MSPFPKFSNWWAVEAMIASYNHIYKTVHKTQYFDLGPVGVSDYGSASISSFQLEFVALDDDPFTVHRAVQNYDIHDRKYVLDVFHGQPSARDIKSQYSAYGYDFVRTGPILGYEIPTLVSGQVVEVNAVETKADLDRANLALFLENETIPIETLNDPHIFNLVAEWENRVVGWAQLVTVYPGVGYIHQIYTLSDFRKRRVGTSLMARAHHECVRIGLNRMALISTDMGMGLFRRLGYRPMAYFTALRPREGRVEPTTVPLRIRS
jgi:GNAT superfamily N-acetyltransferase